MAALRSCVPAWRGPVEIGMRAVRCVLGCFDSIHRCPSRWRCLVGRRASRNDQGPPVLPYPWMDACTCVDPCSPSTSSLGSFAPSLAYRV
uniref:Predicted protein n=1 Tax=Hordeum vulgare subsp. vulgare TaxID=112509 RepID=F2ED58_HORVV|nr:predicted protein [Hordeum vulgare subsp. vulgare]